MTLGLLTYQERVNKMCDCEDRPCCSCYTESDPFGRYEPDPIDAERERLEMDYDYDEDEDENEDTETSIHHEDQDFLND
jgi:hypothetical protein